jgi:hypothetical protein
MVGAFATLLGRHAEAFELLPFEADTDAEFEAAPRNNIDRCDILGEAYRIVKRLRSTSDAMRIRSVRAAIAAAAGRIEGKIPAVDEVMLGQPNVIEAVVLASGNLIEDFAIKPVGGLAPLLRIAEIIPKGEANLSCVVHADCLRDRSVTL